MQTPKLMWLPLSVGKPQGCSQLWSVFPLMKRCLFIDSGSCCLIFDTPVVKLETKALLVLHAVGGKSQLLNEHNIWVVKPGAHHKRLFSDETRIKMLIKSSLPWLPALLLDPCHTDKAFIISHSKQSKVSVYPMLPLRSFDVRIYKSLSFALMNS